MSNRIYDVLTSGILECVHSTKYKSAGTRRFDICNRYNSAVSYILEIADCDVIELATIRGVKGFITKSICDSLSDDDDLRTYIEDVVCPTLRQIFDDREF